MEDLTLIKPGQIRVRMAPSPTGPFHIGSARTALFNYLFAKKHQGIFIVRIEDTDKERSKKEWEDDIKDSLEWLSIIPDESPWQGGPQGPYRQSERKETYKKYIQRLLDQNKVYPCFCSPDDLEAHRQYLMSIGKPPSYSGKCRGLSEEQAEEKIKKGRGGYVFRFKTQPQKVIFEDAIRDKVEYDTLAFGDFVVAKDKETPLYNLACVIDDFEMKISHIIRGEEHIPNTPRQILIAKALGITPPKYVHLPLILNEHRAKLSKRDPNIIAAVLDYKEKGYLPEAVVNFIALLGWAPGTDKEIFSLRQLIKEFSLNKVQKAGAIFNIKKLDWINGYYIRNISLNKLTNLCVPYLIKDNLITPLWGQQEIISGGQKMPFDVVEYNVNSTNEKVKFDYLKSCVGLYQERLKRISEVADLVDFFFKKELDYPKEFLKWKGMTEKEIKDSLDKSKKILSHIKDGEWTKGNIETELMEEAEKIGDRGKLLWPLRVALTGKKASAGPFEIAEVLGQEKTLQRIKEARKKL